MKKKILKLVISFLSAAVLIFLDQWTKQWAVAALKGQTDIDIIPGVLKLHYLENAGMAFGLLQNKQTFFFIITVFILAVLAWLLYKTPEKKRYFWIHLVLVMVMAGAVGNMIDRVSQKYVVDFIYFCLIDFPVFNVADCYVTVAAIIAFILIMFVYKEDLGPVYSLKKAETGAEEETAKEEDADDDI